jgi:hypothetical protein
VLAPWLFVACLPPLVRAGPEAYKGFIIEGIFIPVGTLLLACRAKHVRRRSWTELAGGRLPSQTEPVESEVVVNS